MSRSGFWWWGGAALAVLAAGGAADWAVGQEVGEERMTVMSFNIRYGLAGDGENRWDLRKDLVVGVIREHAPAVIGLQEALRCQLDYLQARLPGYGLIGMGREAGGEGEHAAILYRTDRFEAAESGTFWLSDTPEVVSRHWGNTCLRICTWVRLVEKQTGRGFSVWNTHLDHESQPSREKSVRLIAGRLGERGSAEPAVVMGDFNAGEGNPAVRFLTGGGGAGDGRLPRLRDTFRVLHPDEAAVRTYHAFTGRREGEKIDYILVTPGFRVLAASIERWHEGGRYPSDHFPVTATLAWGGAGEG